MPNPSAVPDVVRTGDQDETALAWHLHSEVVAGDVRARGELLRSTIALKRIHDEKLYLAMGHETFEDYIVSRLGMTKQNAYLRLGALKGLTEDQVKRLTFSSNPPSIAALTRFSVSFGSDPEKLSAVSAEDFERLVSLTSEEARVEYAKTLGYDRSRDGGRGPSDLGRGFIPVHRYRDNSKQVVLLKEKIKNKDAEAEERDRVDEQKDEELKRLREIVMSDDKTRGYELQVEQLTHKLAAMQSAEALTAAQKVDRRAANQFISNFLVYSIRRLNHFRDQIHVPDLETYAWLEMAFDELRKYTQGTFEFIASDALKRFSEDGTPVPLADASAAMHSLVKDIKANLLKFDVEAGLVKIVGRPEKKD